MSTLNQQIEWVDARQKWFKKHGQRLINEGKMTPEKVSSEIDLANATLQTLTQLRGLATRL